MDIEGFRTYCLSLPGSEEKNAFREILSRKAFFPRFLRKRKMFCYFDIDLFDRCTIKCHPEEIEELKETYQSVEPPYNCNPKYWISIKFNEDMPDKEIKRLVRQSYEIVHTHN